MIREGCKLPGDVAEKIPEMLDLVSSDLDIIALFAFGGLARGQLKPLSDLDIAVLLAKRLTDFRWFDKHLQLLTTLNKLFRTDEIDLVVLNDASPRFAHSIIRDGKLLFCRDVHTLINFTESVRKTYFDIKYYQDNFDKLFLEGIGYHG